MRHILVLAGLVALAPTLAAQNTQARILAHQADFDYLLGDWQFTSVSKEYGTTEHLKIEARRIGPRRTMGALAPARRRAP
ncbi:MAG TPA: hypothetical protein VKC15_21430 [Gemmatimonadales bacterium]|nr:hypothetical protein [Gemmatimonadales bacterium]